MRDKEYASIHIEEATRHIIKESGFKRLPIIVSRFYKRSTEIYGRCPSINGFPDILQANIMAESLMLGVEKELDPPLAIPDAGIIGSTFNTGAGGLVVYSPFTGNMSSNPIFPVSPKSDLRIAKDTLDITRLSIQQHY